jgi:hypothetical protein
MKKREKYVDVPGEVQTLQRTLLKVLFLLFDSDNLKKYLVNSCCISCWSEVTVYNIPVSGERSHISVVLQVFRPEIIRKEKVWSLSFQKRPPFNSDNTK